MSFESPIDLIALNSFLSDPFVRKLSESSANEFYSIHQAEATKWIDIDSNGTWAIFPKVWRAYFEQEEIKFGERGRIGILEDIASLKEREDYPTSLTEFLQSCRTFSFDRNCSTIPILSFTPLYSTDSTLESTTISLVASSSQIIPTISTPAATLVEESISSKSDSLSQSSTNTSRPITTRPIRQARRRPKNFTSTASQRAGLSNKKLHEVEKISELVTEMIKNDSKLRYAIDVGSGRGHLSRTLALEHNLHVTAIDSSELQRDAALHLDNFKHLAVQLAEKDTESAGSLTHIVRNLDAPSIKTVLDDQETAMVFALHACGQLTVDTLIAFVQSDSNHRRKMLAIGCCYTYLAPGGFPISNAMSTFPFPTFDLLSLSSQCPATYYSPASTFKASFLKIYHRARLAAEFEDYLVDSTGRSNPLGKIKATKSYEEYRTEALKKMRSDTEAIKITSLPDPDNDIVLQFGKLGEESALFALEVYWLLRSLVGPVVESAIILDRFMFLTERLQNRPENDSDRRTVELINIFDQNISGSLRNLAILIR